MTGYRCWHDVDTISSTSRCRRCIQCKRGMTEYRYLHDVDTISSTSRGMTEYRCLHDVDMISLTSRCRQCKRCKRDMTGYRCLHDIDTISATSRCRTGHTSYLKTFYAKITKILSTRNSSILIIFTINMTLTHFFVYDNRFSWLLYLRFIQCFYYETAYIVCTDHGNQMNNRGASDCMSVYYIH